MLFIYLYEMYIELDIVNIRCYIHLKGVLYGQMMNLDIHPLFKKFPNC